MSARDKFNNIKDQFIVSKTSLLIIISSCVSEMTKGLSGQESSMKMLDSHVYSTPNKQLQGTYYALDWGGTNCRVLKATLTPFQSPNIIQSKIEIQKNIKQCNKPEILFDYISNNFGTKFKELKQFSKNNKQYSMGFCFSFPMIKKSLNNAVLLSWTKGYNVPGCVGNNITTLMENSFKKNNINCKINGIINDTIGTLIAAAYNHENTKIGIIIGTGTNAAYIDDGKIINTEWGNFNKNLPRNDIDIYMDTYTSYPGQYLVEKMISGFYIGELVRLILIKIYGDRIIQKNTILNEKFSQNGYFLTQLLKYEKLNQFDKAMNMINIEYNLMDFELNDIKLIIDVCRLITERSADICSSLLIALLLKRGDIIRENGVFKWNSNDDFITIGIDGGVFENNVAYKPRFLKNIRLIVGDSNADKISVVYSPDGSGIGAALVVASLDQPIKSKL